MKERPYPGYGIETWTEWVASLGPHGMTHRLDHWLMVQVLRHPNRVRATDNAKVFHLPPRGTT